MRLTLNETSPREGRELLRDIRRNGRGRLPISKKGRSLPRWLLDSRLQYGYSKVLADVE